MLSLAVGPEGSAGKRECPRKLLDPTTWPGGGEVVLSRPFEREK